MANPHKKLHFTHDHIPCSVAIHDNVTEAASKFLLNADPQKLIDEFVDHLLELAEINEADQMEHFRYYEEELQELIDNNTTGGRGDEFS